MLVDGASRSIAAVLGSCSLIRVSGSWTSRWGRLPDAPALPNGHYLMVIGFWRLEKRAVATLVKVLRLSESDFAVALG